MAVLEVETPATQAQAAQQRMALLQTRCGCSRVIALPEKATRTVTVDLMPLTDRGFGFKGQDTPEKRTFYLAGETVLDGQVLMVYREGPNPDKPRILVPGMLPPRRFS